MINARSSRNWALNSCAFLRWLLMSCSILALISFSGANVTTSLNQFDRFWAT